MNTVVLLKMHLIHGFIHDDTSHHHHHIEETDAGLNRPLYLRNKLYNKTLKSQNYYSNILRYTTLHLSTVDDYDWLALHSPLRLPAGQHVCKLRDTNNVHMLFSSKNKLFVSFVIR